MWSSSHAHSFLLSLTQLTMERSKEVKYSLGKRNVELLLDEIRSGNIQQSTIKLMALKMHPYVHGVYTAKVGTLELVDVFRYMLDRWYTQKLYKNDVDGFSELVEILEDYDVGLGALVKKMNED